MNTPTKIWFMIEYILALGFVYHSMPIMAPIVALHASTYAITEVIKQQNK